MVSTTIIVPTFNEAPNIAELVRRIAASVESGSCEVLFVDDSDDDTPQEIRRVAAISEIPVRVIHRQDPVGGLSGAVTEGISSSSGEWCLVMDGDLQHPPEMIPVLLATGEATGADVVVASRRVAGGSDSGLSGWTRRAVSSGSTMATRAMFPNRLRNCTDPMTGFFAVRRDSIDVDSLRPQGFKILLEILARNSLHVVEEPFVFGERMAGQSKATLSQGLRFLMQLTSLRFGRLSAFAAIGVVGALANLAIMAGLVEMGVNYVAASVIAAIITIICNFFLQEHFVFRDLRDEGRGPLMRFVQSFTFNGAEAALRLPILAVLVEVLNVPSILAQAICLVLAFVIRFVFMSRVVYRPRRTSPVGPLIADPTSPLGTDDAASLKFGKGSS